MKKVLCFTLAVVMVLMVLAACGDSASSSQSQSQSQSQAVSGSSAPDSSAESDVQGSGIDFDEEPYVLKVLYPVWSEAMPDQQLVQDAVNEIILREINATIELEAVGLFNIANVLALKASAQEKMDLIALMPGYSYIAGFAGSNLIQPLDDVYAEWGSDIAEVLGTAIQGGYYNGQLYAIPQNNAVKRNGYGFHLAVEKSEANNIDIGAIKTLEDLDEALAVIKENEPEMTVLVPEQTGGTVATVLLPYYDNLGTNGSGVLQENADGTLSVVNQFESDVFMQAALKVREWYQLGYISQDVNTAQESGSQMLWAGKAYCVAAPSIGPEMGNNGGVAARSVMFNTPIVRSTGDTQLQVWAVPTSCERPDKAMQLINLLDSSAELTNLLRFGIEGAHYNLVGDGVVELVENAGWLNNWMTFGDVNKMYDRADSLTVVDPPLTVDELRGLRVAWNDAILDSPALGFMFDPTNVKTEVAACDAVNDEFGKAIGNGTVDPVTEIPKLIQRLYDAGLQTIMDEKQAQLDAWLALQ